jgi:hypothetical protein
MLRGIIFILFLSFTQVSLAQSNCQEFANDCEYYSCIEQSKHCGKYGYLMNFGDKYCRKFTSKEKLLSTKGKIWMSNVRSCLIRKLENVDQDLSCQKYRKAAIDQHIPCYTESGYCQLNKKDKNVILKIISGSLWKPTLISAAIKVLKYCNRLH